MPHLNLSANSALELIELLAKTDITVPPVTKGRKEVHRERYVMAHLLATKAEDLFSYPISVVHREKPDFVINQGEVFIGVECVEAVPEEWYEIQALRERKNPNAVIFANHYTPGLKSLSKIEKEECAAGRGSSYPWMGDAPEREWADAMAYFINEKTKKLRAGNYSEFQENWLLIQDEWRVPIHSAADLLKALNSCLPLIKENWIRPCFNKIFIHARKFLVTLTSEGYTIKATPDLWG